MHRGLVLLLLAAAAASSDDPCGSIRCQEGFKCVPTGDNAICVKIGADTREDTVVMRGQQGDVKKVSDDDENEDAERVDDRRRAEQVRKDEKEEEVHGVGGKLREGGGQTGEMAENGEEHDDSQSDHEISEGIKVEGNKAAVEHQIREEDLEHVDTNHADDKPETDGPHPPPPSTLSPEAPTPSLMRMTNVLLVIFFLSLLGLYVRRMNRHAAHKRPFTKP